MSYDIELLDPVDKSCAQFDEKHQMRGGTYAVGGTTSAHLNITYNYGQIFRDKMGDEGIRTIYGMTALESIPILEKAISELTDDCGDSYWDATEGNAKKSLIILLTMAKMRPDCVWSGD
jgi:hypothetical protein